MLHPTKAKFLFAVLSTLSLTILIVLAEETCAATPKMPAKVVVTGAGGQTGQSLFRKLLTYPEEFEPLGFVRTQESKNALLQSGNIPESSVQVVDVTNPNAIKQAVQNFVGQDSSSSSSLAAFCICTSAKPKPTDKIDEETGRPVFGFPDGSPEEVDWLGQKHQIDACPAGTHVVLCSTMGGTDPESRLNVLGREVLPDGTVKGGNIVKWKRKAEVYLMEKSQTDGLTYTIVHPGGLSNEPGGEREIVVGVDDEKTGTDSRGIPREDVAEVMLQAVRYEEEFKNRSFDIRAKPKGEGTVTADFKHLLQSLNGRDCDYSLGETM